MGTFWDETGKDLVGWEPKLVFWAEFFGTLAHGIWDWRKLSLLLCLNMLLSPVSLLAWCNSSCVVLHNSSVTISHKDGEENFVLSNNLIYYSVTTMGKKTKLNMLSNSCPLLLSIFPAVFALKLRHPLTLLPSGAGWHGHVLRHLLLLQ